jgi:ADP-ribose pyrophosphatase YjhB (NUDIX family)
VALSAVAAVRDITGRILLVRCYDTGDWELPGGYVDPGESASDAAIRETAEDSGITAEITGLAGTYTDPGHVIADPRAGQVRQPFAVCFHARPLSGSPGGDQVETSDARWFATGDIGALPIRPAMRIRIGRTLTPGRACHVRLYRPSGAWPHLPSCRMTFQMSLVVWARPSLTAAWSAA